MAASFKIPTSLKRKAKKDPELPTFQWKTFRKRKEVGLRYVWVRIPSKIRPGAEGWPGGGSGPHSEIKLKLCPPLIPHFLPFKKIDNAAVISKPTKSTKA
jgi:hypothetical protein